MNVLGIETSCDETSAAVVVDGNVTSNVISSQLVHRKFGGVVPELASRAHQRLIIEVVQQALADGGVERSQIDAVASTYGPGLIGALLVGLNFGKSLAYGLGIPFIGVNHMEGHLYSNFLTVGGPDYPFLSLIVSGGHTMLVLVERPLQHRLLGETRDDAAGEAFDKVAKMLGLGYPGGPIIDALAREGNAANAIFPRPYLRNDPYGFSFSGIKTSVLYYLRDLGVAPGQALSVLGEDHVRDVCAGFQAAVVDVLVAKTVAAAEETGVADVAVAGGVSANSELRRRMNAEMSGAGRGLFTPPLEYCMDNGAMIAYAGWLRLNAGIHSGLDLTAVANLGLA